MSHDAPRRISIARLYIPDGSPWKRLPLIFGAIGVLGIAVSFLLRGSAPDKFYFSWLAAFLFWLSLALGGLFFVLVLYATKAGWGIVVRRLAGNCLMWGCSQSARARTKGLEHDTQI